MKTIQDNPGDWKKYFFLVLIILKITSAFAQVSGCTDPYANNYDPAATIVDGSCTYDDAYYSPVELVNPISNLLKESSGLQWAGNSLWSFNDKGGSPVIYRIDTASNAILQTVTLGDATNIDWEDAAFDGTYFYVGDFGNNFDGARTDLKIYKFPFSTIPEDYINNPEYTIPARKIEIINFTYKDQPANPEPVNLNSTKFDCEAMIVDDGKIHLFTKDWIAFTSTHYVINSLLAGDYVASPVEKLKAGYLVTGADKAPGQNEVLLLGYEASGSTNHYMHVLSNYSDGKYFNGNKRKITLRNATYMGQAEGITFRNDTYGYISNERLAQFSDQKLFSFSTESFIPLVVLSQELKNFTVINNNEVNAISWSFNLPVSDLQIQNSSDGVHFVVVKKYDSSSTGFITDKPATTNNFYRLAWKQENGTYKYSKIIHLENVEKALIRSLVLRTTGELSFTIIGNKPENIAFKLLTPDGKTLDQKAKHSYAPGFNKINFSGRAILGNIVIIASSQNNHRTTSVVHVLK